MQFPAAGKGTKGLCIALVAITLLLKLSQNSVGVGPIDLVFSVDRVLHGQVWRLLSYALIEVDAWSLILSALFLYLFGAFFEARWGTRDYLRFFAASAVGAALFAIPLSYVFNVILPFDDQLARPFELGGFSTGPSPSLDAMLVALALMAPDSKVMFGFILPIKARTLIYVFIGLQLIFGIMNGTAELSMTVGGMLMGYILVSGIWRPQMFAARWHTWTRRRRRRGLHVVKPPDHTLH
ncbi:MAG: rhomboid family intramembrane serine protease [Myxococcota bacterium]